MPPTGTRGMPLPLCLAALLSLAACASANTSFYTLFEVAPVRALPAVSGATLGVGRLAVPEALDRPQVVRRESDSLLNVDDFSRWAGPLADGIGRVLTGDLRQRLGSDRVVQLSAEPVVKPSYVLETQIDRFDVDMAGHLVLQAHWSVASGIGEQVVVLQRASAIREDAAPGIDGAVGGMSHALGRLADEVAAAVAVLPARPAPATRDISKPTAR